MAESSGHNLIDGASNRINLELATGIKVKACPGGAVEITDNNGNGIRIASGGAVTVIGSGSLPAAPVISVFGRTGAVVAGSGDYLVNQVTGAAPLASPALTGNPTVNGNSLAPASEILEAVVPISAAQILNFDATRGTDVVIVPAPGNGFAIIPDSLYLNFQVGGTPYTTGTGNIEFQWVAGGALTLAVTNPAIGATQVKGAVSVIAYIAPNANQNLSVFNNAALVLNQTAATKFLAGNGVIIAIVRYRIVAVA